MQGKDLGPGIAIQFEKRRKDRTMYHGYADQFSLWIFSLSFISSCRLHNCICLHTLFTFPPSLRCFLVVLVQKWKSSHPNAPIYNVPFPNPVKSSPSSVGHLAGKLQFKSVAQSFHVGVRVLHQLKSIWNHFNGPRADTGTLSSLEAQVEVTWVFCIQAESVY
jgi:hypothetical protein